MALLADIALRLSGQANSTINETSSYKRKHKVIFLNLIPSQSAILLLVITEISWWTVCQYLLSPVDVLSVVRVDLR